MAKLKRDLVSEILAEEQKRRDKVLDKAFHPPHDPAWRLTTITHKFCGKQTVVARRDHPWQTDRECLYCTNCGWYIHPLYEDQAVRQ